MAEALIYQEEPSLNPPETDGSSEVDRSSGLFHRRIEFHLARKPFSGFGNGDKGGFQLETLNPSSKTDTQRISGPGHPGKKGDKSEFTENGLDPELSFGITFKRIGAGLQNLGNTCFLNSVLQCLTYTEPLAAYLQSGKHQNSCRTAGFCALCAIQKHVRNALHATGRIVAPKDLVSNLRCISRNFRNARQEDAHEYMVNLLESMHKCCLPSGVPSESPGAYEKSLVHKIFGGRLRSQVKCMQCSFCSNKFDPFLDLSLEIVKADSVYKALCHFTAKEQLDGGEKQYNCQQCKQKVKALKQLTVHKPPHVLTIHLKRFGSHVPGQKIDKKIQFGPTLDLQPFVTGPYDGDLKYTLYGVLVHAGWSTHSGHYYCFVRTSSGMWYSLDDNQVIQVNERKVLEQKAYMLFYVRDRKSYASKKSVDVIQKDNVLINAMGHKAYHNSNQVGKVLVQNGLTERKPDFATSAAADQRDAPRIAPLKGNLENPMKDFSQKATGPCNDKCLSRNGNTLSESLSKMPSIKDLMNASHLNLNGGECLQQTTSSIRLSVGSAKNENAMIQTVDKIVGCSVASGAQKDLHASTSKPSDRSVLQLSVDERDSSNPTSRMSGCHEDNGKDGVPKSVEKLEISSSCSTSGYAPNTDLTTFVKVGGNAPPVDAGKEALNQRIVEGGKVGCISSVRLDMLSEEDHTGQQMIGLETIPAPARSSRRKKVLGRPKLKLKKKPFKRQVIRMHLSSNILLGTALGMRRKKKHRLGKHEILGNEYTHLQTVLNGSSAASDFEPSTSEQLNTPCLHHPSGLKQRSKSCSHGKGIISGVKRVTENGHLPTHVADEFESRVSPSDATDKQLDKGSVLSEERSNISNPDGTTHYRRDAKQNDLMSMLTRGLEETTVGRWDGIEGYPMAFTESREVQSVSIGYVGDDWDDEYDRGKRKKLRKSKDIFDGPNPFQEIASKKAKVKKVKLGRINSGNQPLRIL